MKEGGYILIDGKWEEFGKEISRGLNKIKKKKVPKWIQLLLFKKYFKNNTN